MSARTAPCSISKGWYSMNKPVNMAVTIAGVAFKNPVIVASGAFGFGREYDAFYDISKLGGISVKGLTLTPRKGNPPPRVAETPAGMLNSVGLQNPGVAHFVEEELPWLLKRDIAVIANIAGNTIAEYCEMARILSDTGTHMVELNISCPNVKEGGVAFGVEPRTVEKVTRAVRDRCTKPLIVKLSPNVKSIADTARAAQAGGADAVSLINTLTGMRIDITTRRPVLRNNVGGLSGPAVLPVAVRMVYEVRKAVDLPIIGMGGVSRGADAAELIIAGADAVAVGTACFSDPFAPVRIIDELRQYAESQGICRIGELSGSVRPY